MTRATVDGNEAAASVAYRLNEVCCIYPITPSSPMAELADEWSSQGRPNLWGGVPAVVEMQSEGGAAGALHGALQSGALATTFTSSQGLLLMIPNMYKIAGELTPAVLHVAARSVAAQGLSIFGDHSDVMAVRQTGFALLASASVQEAHDLALVAQAATLATRVPFVHFFDGFRTSHELNTIELLSDDDLRALAPGALVRAHRGRALSPERPFIRGTAQNPDVYFQARETVNPFYAAVPDAVQHAMDGLAARAGRQYHIMDYAGHPEAERVIVVMGSAAQTVGETVAHLCTQGERVGVLQVRLFRPAVVPAVDLSSPREARLPRTWISILRHQVRASLAATTGVDEPSDVVKYLLAGADVVMTASALIRHGPEHCLRRQSASWQCSDRAFAHRGWGLAGTRDDNAARPWRAAG
jgi:pyruvate-ferredoxin/flavodoxin oxidoreductase